MPMREKSLDNILRVGIAVAIVILISSVWVNTYLPFQDYPEWLFQAQLTGREMVDGIASNFGYELVLFPTQPNVVVSAILVGLQPIMPIEIAGKILLTLILLVFILGWRAMMRASAALHPLRWLGISFAFHYFFYLGFLSYSLGIALVMPCVAWLFSSNALVSLRNIVAVGLLAVFLYLVHGVAFGIFVVAILVRVFMKGPFTISQALVLCSALVPSFLLVAALIVYGKGPASLVLHETVWHQMLSWRYALSLFNRLIPFQPEFPVSLQNGGALAVVASLFVLTWRGAIVSKPYRVLALCMTMLGLLVPFQRVGNFFPLNARFVLPAVAFFAASCVVAKRARWVELTVMLLGLSIAIGNATQLSAFNKGAEAVAQSVRPFMEKRGNVLVLGRGFVEEFDKNPWHRFSGGIRTLVHFRRYIDMYTTPSFVRTFESGLLQHRGHTAELVALDSALEASQHLDEAIAVLHTQRDMLKASVDCVIVMGKDLVLERFRDALTTLFDEKKREPFLLVMVRRDTIMHSIHNQFTN